MFSNVFWLFLDFLLQTHFSTKKISDNSNLICFVFSNVFSVKIEKIITENTRCLKKNAYVRGVLHAKPHE